MMETGLKWHGDLEWFVNLKANALHTVFAPSVLNQVCKDLMLKFLFQSFFIITNNIQVREVKILFLKCLFWNYDPKDVKEIIWSNTQSDWTLKMNDT